MRRLLVFFVVLAIATPSVMAQRRSAEDEQNESEPAYEPYEAEEFAPWMHSLRRGEVIFFGAFPITMLFTALAYDGYSIIRDALATDAAAGTAGTELGQFTKAESAGILIAGSLLSVAVAAVDFFIRRNDGVE